MKATEAQVRAVPTPDPTGRWHPIGHGRLLDEINGAVEEMGLDVTDRRYDLLDGGDKFFGTYQIGDFRQAQIPGEVGFQIGFRGSINKTMAEAVVFGTTVFICSNGMMSGERIISRKNTTNILTDLWMLVRNALSGFHAFRQAQTAQYERLAATNVTDAEAHDFICRCLRANKMITGQMVQDIVKEWHDPSHDFGDKTAWRLHNAFTEVAKPGFDRNPITATQRTVGLNSMFAREWTNDN
jgi:hypothetical protein|tara:strand:- start:4186 stop:4905 length:720 start_codon:yes stop_codon:yes gene_type:complete